MRDYLRISKSDNVVVALRDMKKGEIIEGITLLGNIPKGHKIAVENIPKGAHIIKYANCIGSAKCDIQRGEQVHTHNTRTNLDEGLEYSYNKQATQQLKGGKARTVEVYERKNGLVGVRNELWIVPTVGCVNSQARLIAEQFKQKFGNEGYDGIFVFSHPYGCSQLGEDHNRTKCTLQRCVTHPNAGGVLVLGLGCENNQLPAFKQGLGDYDTERIRFLQAQDVEDEIEEGVRILGELLSITKNDRRVTKPISVLNIGLKCGGSDGFSGITANPLLGAFSDYLTEQGGTTVLTEVPEMFGAEHLLMARAKDKEVFEKIVKLINGFKDYYIKNGQPVYENPSPGNQAGGITTLEDKSLGCTQKSGTNEVVDVLFEGDVVSKKGLNLLQGPGNDIVAVTNLGAAGCHMVLFTTGRGTPLGGFVPTIKVATNTELFNKKSNWMDFDAGGLVKNQSMEQLCEQFIDFIVKIASGQKTKSELMNARDIAIFKSGVTL